MKYKILSIVLLSIIFFGFSSDKNSKFDYLISIETNFGEVKAILFDDTPIHKNNFIKLAEAGKYDGSEFHRVINGFMIQGGSIDHSNDGYDTLSFEDKTLKAELETNHKHIRGAIAAARVDNPEKRSDNSQFYIVQNCLGAHHLDGGYTVFGQVLFGMDVVDKIAQTKVNGSKPVEAVKMKLSVKKVKRKDLIEFYGDVYSKYNVK